MYQIAPGFIRRRIADAEILVSMNVAVFNGYITLNETCAFLLDRMKAPQTAEQLAQQLAEQYEVTLPQAMTDVAEMLQALVARGVVREVTV